MRDFFIKPLQGIIAGFLLMLGAHILVVAIIRPAVNFINNLTFLGILEFFGIKVIPFAVFGFILKIIYDHILGPQIQKFLLRLVEKLNKYVFQFIRFAFFSVGKGFHPVYLFFGDKPGYIIIFPVVFGICFFSTFLDYLSIQAQLDISLNIFSDRIIKDMEEVVPVSLMIDWISKDQVSIDSFGDYWFYSLRASVLGLRFEGWSQWLIALPINLFASIIFIIFSMNLAIRGLMGFQYKWDKESWEFVEDYHVQDVNPNPVTNFNIFIGIIIAVLLFVAKFTLSALSLDGVRYISQSRLTQASVLTPPPQPRLTPQQTVAKYYELATYDREAALELIGESWKRAERKNKEEGIKFWSSIEQVRVYGTDIIEQSSNRVIVKVWLQYYMKYEDYNPCETRTFDVRLNTDNQWVLHLPIDVVQKPSCDY